MTISIGYCSRRSSAFSVVSARSARKPNSVATCPQISRVGGSSSTMRTVLGAEAAGEVPVSTCVSIQPPDTEFHHTSNGGRQWEEGMGTASLRGLFDYTCWNYRRMIIPFAETCQVLVS